jgi:hypothetical protein
VRFLKREPAFRTVPNPRNYDQFANYTSGDGHHERGVNNLVHRQHQGIAHNTATMVVLEDPASQELIGTCGHRPADVQFAALAKNELPAKHLPKTRPNLTVPAIYIHVIGLCKNYRGCRRPAGGRLGERLLRCTMTEIAKDYVAKPMPIMWAYVAEDNYYSHRLFEALGFGLIAPSQKGNDTIRYRPAGLELPRE